MEAMRAEEALGPGTPLLMSTHMAPKGAPLTKYQPLTVTYSDCK